MVGAMSMSWTTWRAGLERLRGSIRVLDEEQRAFFSPAAVVGVYDNESVAEATELTQPVDEVDQDLHRASGLLDRIDIAAATPGLILAVRGPPA